MIQLEDISKSFNGNKVLDNLSFNFENGSIVTIIGPSGCGKTTILNLITGLLKQDSGKIITPDNVLISYMMQDHLLLPWRTLRQNLALGLEVLALNHSEHIKKLDTYINQFDLEGYEDYYPDSLSGGMKQRVALIRSLLCKPDVFLLDEPFSNLDFDIKMKIQRLILRYHYQNSSSTIIVTHDIEDAIALSDYVIVLSDKPTQIKKTIPINLEINKKDPVEARKSPRFREYFIQIWDELKYLDD